LAAVHHDKYYDFITAQVAGVNAPSMGKFEFRDDRNACCIGRVGCLLEFLRDSTTSIVHVDTTKSERNNMIDHVILTVSDFKRSVVSYTKALKPLGITNFIDYESKDGHPDLKGFGDGERAFFWLTQAVHVGFVAKDHSAVDAFYKVALAAGGKSKKSPQARPEYHPGY
jgi:hypothetical protein